CAFAAPAPTDTSPPALHDSLPVSTALASQARGDPDLRDAGPCRTPAQGPAPGRHPPPARPTAREPPLSCACTARCSPTGCAATPDRKSTRLHSSHVKISYALFCLK